MRFNLILWPQCKRGLLLSAFDPAALFVVNNEQFRQQLISYLKFRSKGTTIAKRRAPWPFLLLANWLSLSGDSWQWLESDFSCCTHQSRWHALMERTSISDCDLYSLSRYTEHSGCNSLLYWESSKRHAMTVEIHFSAFYLSPPSTMASFTAVTTTTHPHPRASIEYIPASWMTGLTHSSTRKFHASSNLWNSISPIKKFRQQVRLGRKEK